MAPRRSRILAVMALLLSLGGLAAFVRLRYFSILPLIGALAIGSAAYLVLLRRAPARTEDAPAGEDPGVRRRVRLLTAAAFFSLTAASLLIASAARYGKPIEYYLLVSAAAALLAVHIGALDRTRQSGLAVGMILVLALNLFGSSQLAFPLGIGGADAPTHLRFLVVPIVETGAIPRGAPCGLIYPDFPVHHILTASTAIVAGADPARAYYGLGVALMTLPVLVAYLVGRTLFGIRAGLIAALLLTGASYYMFWSSHAAPLGYAIPVIAVLVYVFLRLVRRTDSRDLVFAALLGAALILTHPYSSVVFGFVLVGILGGLTVARQRRGASWGVAAAAVSYVYILLFDWSNFSCMMTKSFRLAQGYIQTIVEETTVSPPAVYDALPLGSILVNTLGDSMLFAAASVGFFLLLTVRSDVNRALVLGPTIALLAISGAGIVLDLAYLLPNRLYVFLQVIGLAPLAAVGMMAGYRRGTANRGARRKWASLLLVGVFVGGYVFASSASTVAGFETSLFTGGRPFAKLYDTAFEDAGAGWVCERAGSPPVVVTSLSLHQLARYEITGCLVPAGVPVPKMALTRDGEINLTLVPEGALLVFSRYDFDPGFLAAVTDVGRPGAGVYERLTPEAAAVLAEMDRVYDNGVIEIVRQTPEGWGS